MAGSPPPRKIFLVVVGLVALAAFPVMKAYFYPPEEAGVRVITNDGNRMIGAHASGVQKDLNNAPYRDPKGKVDLDKWSRSRMPAAESVADARNRRDAAITRAEGRAAVSPVLRIYVKSGDRVVGWAGCMPFHEPMVISVDGYVKNLRHRTRDSTTPVFKVPLDDGYEMVGPNGTDRRAVGGFYPNRYELPIDDDKRYLAVIGRVAHVETRQPLTEPFLVGAGGVFEPAKIGANGCMQFAVNVNPYLREVPDDAHFTYTFHPVK